MLNLQEIERFWDDGFLVVEDLFAADEIEILRAACMSPEDRKWESASETIHSLNLTPRDPVVLNLARDPRIVERLISLLGPDIQLQHSKLAAKPLAANEGPFGWHQDFSYFPHTNTSLVAVMVLLDDATPENGCMSMVRGSHKLGLRNHMLPDGYFTGSCLETEIWEGHPELVIPIPVRAGGISMHHCLTLHGSPANLSGMPRRGIVFQYRASDAFQLAGTIWHDTGLTVAGESHGVVRCESATYQMPKAPGCINDGYGDAWQRPGDFAQKVNATHSPVNSQL